MGEKEANVTAKLRSKCLKLSIIFLFLHIVNLVCPVKGFSMRYCRLSYNKAICSKHDPPLKAVPQDVPSTVTGLDLSSNRISKIQASDFKNLPHLTELYLNVNNISQIETGAFADLISLSKLNLNNNALGKLGDDLFDGLSNLTELRISANSLTAVASTSFKSMASLRVLDISNNKLHELRNVRTALQHLPNLRHLSLKSNNISTFQSWQLTNSSLKLATLDLSKNPIAVFRITAAVFPNLTFFSIGGSLRNKSVKWDVRNNTFLGRVSTLDISGLHLSFDMKTFLESFNSSLSTLRMNAMEHVNLTALISNFCTIPTMSKLHLQHNRLHSVPSYLFHLCSNVTELDLANNKIQYVDEKAFRPIQGLTNLTLKRNNLSSVPAAALRHLQLLAELDLSGNNIKKLQCTDFANMTNLRKLYLFQNSIKILQECHFKDLTQLQILKLNSNEISKLESPFKNSFPKLISLDLNANQLTAIEPRVFEGLGSLRNLSLHFNCIQVLHNESFSGLTNLTEMLLQSNKIDAQNISNGCLNHLKMLIRLDLRNNRITYSNSSPLPNPPFSELSLLKTLAMHAQHHRGKSFLPNNILQGLTNLLDYSTRNGQLLSLPVDMFKYTPQLQRLDVSSNDLLDLSADLFVPIRSLKALYISRTGLQSLDFLIDANLTELNFMQARRNSFSIITEDVMNSLPALIYVDFQGTSFTCDCDNAWFLQWTQNDKQTLVFDAYNFECNYPTDLKGMKLLDFDIQSCSVDIEFICFVSTTFTILLFMVVNLTYHFLRWQLVYAYYLFLALLVDTKRKNKKTPYQYDAFISYNTHDEPWVIRELLPKLEGEQGWRLCLHHRDFEPGKPIIENITDAIYGSRKTICVISQRYLESEWCSREIQVASFRLFDEQKDVLILIFLEDIPTTQLSPFHRIRKLLKRRTYLSWPQAREHPELFWEKLRNALKTRDVIEDRFLLMDRP